MSSNKSVIFNSLHWFQDVNFLLCITLNIAWIVFIILKIYEFRKKYAQIEHRVSAPYAQIEALNNQNRFLHIIYCLIMFILVNELSEVFYIIATRLVYYDDWNFVEVYPRFMYKDCRNGSYVIFTWEAQIINPVIAAFFSLGKFGILNEFALFIIVLKLTFNYYTHDGHYTSIMKWSLKAFTLNSFLLILGIIPQTKLIQIILNPLICITYYISTIKNFNNVSKALGWVCSDLSYEQTRQGRRLYRYHVNLHETFKKLQTITLLALFIIIIAEMAEDFKNIITAILTPRNIMLYHLYGLRIPTIFHTCKQQLFIEDSVFGNGYTILQIVLVQLGLFSWFGPLTCISIRIVIRRYEGKLRLRNWQPINYKLNYENGYRLI